MLQIFSGIFEHFFILLLKKFPIDRNKSWKIPTNKRRNHLTIFHVNTKQKVQKISVIKKKDTHIY